VTRPPQKRKGFTLVEVTMAIALLGGLGVALYGVLLGSLDTANESNLRLRALLLAQERLELAPLNVGPQTREATTADGFSYRVEATTHPVCPKMVQLRCTVTWQIQKGRPIRSIRLSRLIFDPSGRLL